jgi:hypothetical protein
MFSTSSSYGLNFSLVVRKYVWSLVIQFSSAKPIILAHLEELDKAIKLLLLNEMPLCSTIVDEAKSGKHTKKSPEQAGLF